MLVFLGIFLANLLSAFLATNIKIKKYFRNYQITHNNVLDNNEAKNPDMLQLIYTSYSNIFLITRTVATQSASNINLAILLQPAHFLLGLMFICVFKSWDFYDLSDLLNDRPSYFYNYNYVNYNNNSTAIFSCIEQLMYSQ